MMNKLVALSAAVMLVSSFSTVAVVLAQTNSPSYTPTPTATPTSSPTVKAMNKVPKGAPHTGLGGAY